MTEAFYTVYNVGDLEGLETFRKTYTTTAVRMPGTFHCLTSEGNVASCTDGWLAIDSRGYPYPINDTEFHLTYEPAPQGHAKTADA